MSTAPTATTRAKRATGAFRVLSLVTGMLIVTAIISLALYFAFGLPESSDHHGWVGPGFDLTAAAAGVVQAATIAVSTRLAARTRGFIAVATVASLASLASAFALVAVVAGRPVLDWLYGVLVLAWVPLWIWAARFSRQGVSDGALPRWVAFPVVWLASPLWFVAASVCWRSESAKTPPWHALFTVTAAFAWLGFFLHNVADLPGQTILSPESLYPTLLTLALLILWLVPATRTFGAWALMVWVALNLVGGALSVLPLPILPFVPEQSFEHYTFHVAYAVTQVPLLVVCAAWLRRGERAIRLA